MKSKATPFVENISESAAACLITMVQGNLLALSVGHWIIASQTGVIAGVVASVALIVARTQKRWVVAVLLGLITSGVDYVIHPGAFGPAWMEAALTGVGAAALSLMVGTLVRRVRRTSAQT